MESTAGVQCGGSPGNPATCSMRGFTQNQITQLYDGIRVGPATMTSRPLDPFNFASIDILRGPASVLYGEGAVAGAMNFVPRRPVRGAGSTDVLLSYGSYNTLRLGVGTGGSSADNRTHYRVDVSRQSSDGRVDRTAYQYLALTSAVLWDLTDRLSLQASLDVSRDDISPYWGTPLVPGSFAADPLTNVVSTSDGRTLDRRMLERNYNVADNVMESSSVWAKLRADYRASDALRLRNEFYYFHAEREWRNAETYTFNTGTSLIDRDRFFVAHNQNLVGNRLDATLDLPVAGLPNRVLGGIDVSYLDFKRPSSFLGGDSVSPLNPAPGLYGSLDSALQTTRIQTIAMFAEDVLTVLPNLKLVGGLRGESINLERVRYDTAGALVTGPQGGFDKTFTATSWRAGAVYEALPKLNIYGQLSTGQDPVDTNVFLVRARENFDLSRSFQWELGAKQTLWDDRAEWSVAWFDITRKNILSRTAQDVVSNVGQQSSNGLELNGAIRPVPALRLGANYAFTNARFDSFRTGQTADQIFDGNRPPNVPRQTANLFGTWSFDAGLPVEVGGNARYVGERVADNRNTLTLKSYTTVDVFAALLYRDSRLTFRVRNLFDRDYAYWTDVFYPDQILVGLPRTYEVSLTAKF
jgi:iron complex outermembrane receptor protein